MLLLLLLIIYGYDFKKLLRAYGECLGISRDEERGKLR